MQVFSVLRWFRRTFARGGRFTLPARTEDLPSCNIRALDDNDFEICESIYRLNESRYLPPGYTGVFSDWLRNRRASILVLEFDGKVVGLGGINIKRERNADLAALTFGLVHPDFQRRGIGTVLLLARLLLLPPTNSRWMVVLTTTDKSFTFYSRFGFTFMDSTPDVLGVTRDTHFVKISSSDAAAFRMAIWRSTVSAELSGVAISSTDSLFNTSTLSALDINV
jgi:[ribosomal protein S18]-alanine N-acetyltransferase